MIEKKSGDQEVMPDGRTATWRVDADFVFDSGGGVLDPRAYLYCNDCKKRVKVGESCTCVPQPGK